LLRGGIRSNYIIMKSQVNSAKEKTNLHVSMHKANLLVPIHNLHAVIFQFLK